MASTNKTTHYELSQYVGTDKPTYLTDYNQDMSRIDAGIYGAKSLADVNETAIGDLTNLTTTAKSNLVSAINELDGEVTTNTANISTNTSNISTNATNIGNLNNLTTASKTNLVGAINEVDANCDSNTSAIATNTSAIGTLSNLATTVKTDLVSAINEVNNKKDVYDTTETLTSELWENHPIYRKVFDITWNGASSPAIATGLTGIKVVRLFGTDISATGGAFPIPSIRPGQDGYNMGLFFNNGTINIQTSGTVDRTGHSGWVCIEYYYDNN